MVNTPFQVFDLVSSSTAPTILRKFSLDADILYIQNQDCISGLSCLTENDLLIDTQDRCLRNAISGRVIACPIRYIASVAVLDWDVKPLEDGEIVLIIAAREPYSRSATCFASQQAARLPESKP